MGAGTTLTLLDNVTTSTAINVGVSKTLDLNGKTITTADPFSRIISVAGSGVTFTLLDSSGNNSGRLTTFNTTSDWNGTLYVNRETTVNMYGGTISGNNGVVGTGVWIDGRGGNSPAVFNMYGGVITGNSATTAGGGVYVGRVNNLSAATGQFNMYGGTITNNTAPTCDNVYVDHGIMTMTGGTIDGGFSHNDYVEVTFNANGGTGTMSKQYVKKGANTKIKANEYYNATGIKTAPAFSREGYTFAGWNTQSDGNGTNYTAGESNINIVTILPSTPSGRLLRRLCQPSALNPRA